MTPTSTRRGGPLPISRNLQLDSDQAQQTYDWIVDRQVGRCPLVWLTEENNADH